MHRLLLPAAWGLLLAQSVSGQQWATISGFLTDAESGESLIAATVAVQGTTMGTVTNDYGFYSLSLPVGTYRFVYSYLGYETWDTLLSLATSLRLNVALKPRIRQLDEVVVRAQVEDANVSEAQMGRFDLPLEKIGQLPVLFGEQDVLKVIQLLPGVQSGNEGTTGFHVRGGGADQNLILLDEATIYNASHLFGFFSVFNSDAILNAQLYKAGMPAQYGGRISSVLDLVMKEGNNRSFHGSGGIGLIASRLTLEGPLVKERASFIVSGRRTYVDILMRPWLQQQEFAGTSYYFYDMNAKVNYRFSDNDRLFLSGYFGRDVFRFRNDYIQFEIPWGNATTTLRWNHLFSDRLFMNTSVVYNAYDFSLSGSQEMVAFQLISGIRDLNVKWDVDYYPSTKHQLKWGGLYIYHVFQPQSFSARSGETEVNPEGIPKRYAHEGALYVHDVWEISRRWKVSAGLRLSVFEQVGPAVIYSFDPLTGEPIDSITYQRGKPIKTFWGPEPRLTARYALNDVSSVKASWTLNRQYVHLVSSNGTTLPTDLWVPSSVLVKPQLGYQYAVGYFRNWWNHTVESSVEVYYKKLLNQIEFREGYTPSVNEPLEHHFVFGSGQSYGLELYVSRQGHGLTGWIGYTLSFTDRMFPDLNRGQPFPYRFDRRHYVTAAAHYPVSKRWTLGAQFVYATGIAYTLPKQKYIIEGNVITYYDAINDYRLPPYHRLDLSANLRSKKDKRVETGWSFSVYNVYNRYNVFFLYNEVEGIFLQDPALHVQAKQVSLFPIIPSVTWNFRF